MPRPRKADEASKYASVVREMSSNGLSQRRIAESLNLSQSTVSRLIASAPQTGVDRIQAGVSARSGYHAAAQARHDAFHAGSAARVQELTGRLAKMEAGEFFSGHRWSVQPESDELCRFFRHGDDLWS